MDRPQDSEQSFPATQNKPVNSESLHQDDRGRQQSQPPRRVCVTCRRRKVGCDKKHPCQNCKRSNTECIYIADQPSARSSLEDAQIWNELRRLGPLFKSLADRMVQDGDRTITPASTAGPMPDTKVSRPTIHPTPANTTTEPVDITAGDDNHFEDLSRAIRPRSSAQNCAPPLRNGGQMDRPPPMHEDAAAHLSSIPPSDQHVTGLEQARDSSRNLMRSRQTSLDLGEDFCSLKSETPPSSTASSWPPYGNKPGILVRDKGKCRYVSGRFWGTLHEPGDSEDEQAADESDSDDESSLKGLSASPFQFSLLFNTPVVSSSLGAAHQPQLQRLLAWRLFKQNVHPIMTILHLPTVEPLILGLNQESRDLSPSAELLVMVVNFAAVVSVREDTCRQEFGASKQQLLPILQRGAEQAFSRANLMETNDLMVLQAFVLFIMVIRCTDPIRSWNLTGIALRLLQSLGIHRDGTVFDLSPFETEMRRRLWWSFCNLDVAASEDHSCSSTVLELGSSDTKLPLNVNDADISPEMTVFPQETGGMSDVCLLVAQSVVTDIWRTMYDTRRTVPYTGTSFASMTYAEKRQWVDIQHLKTKQRLFRTGAVHDPLHRYTFHFVEIIFCNLRLFVDDSSVESNQSCEQNPSSFDDALNCMVHSQNLRMEPQFSNWSWLTNTFNEWHSFSVIMEKLQEEPASKDTKRAWQVIEQFILFRWDSPKDARVHHWRSAMKSVEKARKRRKQLRRNKTLPPTGSQPTQGRSMRPQPPQSSSPHPAANSLSSSWANNGTSRLGGPEALFTHPLPVAGNLSSGLNGPDIQYDFNLDNQLIFAWNSQYSQSPPPP